MKHFFMNSQFFWFYPSPTTKRRKVLALISIFFIVWLPSAGNIQHIHKTELLILSIPKCNKQQSNTQCRDSFPVWERYYLGVRRIQFFKLVKVILSSFDEDTANILRKTSVSEVRALSCPITALISPVWLKWAHRSLSPVKLSASDYHR